MNTHRCRTALRSLLLLFLAMTLTVIWFAQVALVDAGSLNHTGDDTAIFLRVGQIHGIGDFLRSYADHLIPTTYVLYWAFGHAFGTNWYPYGAALLVAHALICWSISHIVLAVGRSFVSALFILALLATSIPLLAGPFFSFVQIAHYYVALSCLAASYVLWLRDRSRHRWHVIALAAIITTAVFAVSSGLFLFVVVALFVVFLTAAKILFGLGPSPRDHFMSAVDWPVIGVLVTCVTLYGATSAYGVALLGNPIPGTVSVGEAVPSRPLTRPARALNLLEYCYSGLFFPNFSEDYRDDHLVIPFVNDMVMTNTTPVLLVVFSLVLLPTALFLVSGAPDDEDRRLAAMVIAAAVTSVTIALLTVAGRPIVPYWVTRYAIYSFVFASMSVGLSLALWFRLIERLARGEGAIRRLLRPVAWSMLLAIGLLLAVSNAPAVRRRVAEFSQTRTAIRGRATVDWQVTWQRR